MAAKTIVQGKLDVSLASDGLEAQIRFEPGDSSTEIELASVLRLLQTKNIREGILPKELEAFIGKLRGAKAAISQTAAKGAPPQEAVAEKPVWEELPVPPELEANGKKILEAAGPPAIYIDKVENIKHEKTVLKKSPIPFAPPRKEKVVEIEKKVTKVKADIEPEITGTGYAAEGALIAQVQPFTPGKPGKSVTGALIPVKNSGNPYVYAGKGVQKKNGKLTALTAGFLRRGKNWAEIIPFRAHEWKVVLSPGRNSCILQMKPGDVAATVPTGEIIRAAAAALPYQEARLLPAEDIYVLARNLVAENMPAEVPIDRPEDARMEIKVSEDRLEASLFLKKGRGSGKALSLKEVGKLIQSNSLGGLNLKKIQADILAFYKGGEETLENYILAKGRPPAPGSAAEIHWEITFMAVAALENLKKSMPPPAPKAARKTENPESPVNLASAQEAPPDPYTGIESLAEFPVSAAEMAAFVSEGEQILSLKPGKPGTPGTDVYGSPLPPPAGKTAPLICRENVKQEQNSVKALTPGILEARKNGESFEIRIRPHADGQAVVTIAPDSMEAFLTVIPALGTGCAVTPSDITAAVDKAGIAHKAQTPDILETLKKKAAAGGGFNNLSFAKGKPPQHGMSAQLSILAGVPQDKAGGGDNKKEDNKNPHTVTHTIIGVKKDQAVAEILASRTVPEDGFDVRGNTLPARAASAETIHIGENLREEKKEHGVLLIAGVNGELQFDEHSISVAEAHVINGDVDTKTGNIKFSGAVSVAGFVRTGFFIMARGDIKVAQGVEAALLSSEGSITVEQGIKGMGKAVLRSKKDISAAFAERALIMSVGNITIKTACARCQVKCNGKLSLASDKAFLAGGKVKSRLGLETASLGNQSGIQTEISFGQDYLLADQAETVEKTIQKLNTSCANLNVLMREAEKNNDQQKRESCRAEKLKAMKQIEKLNHELLTLREKFEEHFPGEIIVHGTLYPGVVIESHGRYYEVKQPKTKVKFIFDQESGKIVEKQIVEKQI